MWLIRYPKEGIRQIGAQVRARFETPGEPSRLRADAESEKVTEHNSRIDTLFHVATVRATTNSPRFRGQVALIFGKRSKPRFLPKAGLRTFVAGAIDVHTIEGEHFRKLFESDDLTRKVEQCLAKVVGPVPVD